MSLVDTSTLLAVSDRAAYQYMLLSNAIDICNTGLGFAGKITLTNNIDLEVPAGPLYNLLDNNLNVAHMVRWGTPMGNVIYGMEQHFLRPNGSGGILQAGAWDGYLASNNCRVSEWFDDLYFSTYGAHLLAINVFSENNDLFGGAVINGLGVVSFTNGVDYGDGSSSNYSGNGFWAATQLLIRVIQIGANSVSLDVRVKDLNNNLETISVTIPANAPAGTFIDIGTTSDRCLDVTNMTLTSGSQFTNGDSFEIYNKKERNISL